LLFHYNNHKSDIPVFSIPYFFVSRSRIIQVDQISTNHKKKK